MGIRVAMDTRETTFLVFLHGITVTIILRPLQCETCAGPLHRGNTESMPLPRLVLVSVIMMNSEGRPHRQWLTETGSLRLLISEEGIRHQLQMYLTVAMVLRLHLQSMIAMRDAPTNVTNHILDLRDLYREHPRG